MLLYPSFLFKSCFSFSNEEGSSFIKDIILLYKYNISSENKFNISEDNSRLFVSPFSWELKLILVKLLLLFLILIILPFSWREFLLI